MCLANTKDVKFEKMQGWKLFGVLDRDIISAFRHARVRGAYLPFPLNERVVPDTSDLSYSVGFYFCKNFKDAFLIYRDGISKWAVHRNLPFVILPVTAYDVFERGSLECTECLKEYRDNYYRASSIVVHVTPKDIVLSQYQLMHQIKKKDIDHGSNVHSNLNNQLPWTLRSYADLMIRA